MIVYFDASVLVKRYLAETGSAAVERLFANTELPGTSLISRAEVSAALRKAVRMSAITLEEGAEALKAFRSHWIHLARLKVEETTVAQADALAWEYDLRGYDAVHLASALLWQEAVGEPVTLAAFDQQLWNAAQKAGFAVWPESL